MSDPGLPDVPHPPYEDLRTAAADDANAARSVDALHAELHAEQPNASAVREHASALRGIPALEARIANWWDDPETQRWVLIISETGL